MSEFWWRLRYAIVWARRWGRYGSPLFAIRSAWACEYDPDYAPTDAVDSELSYWAEE
jgi:hypothetical protein